MNSFIFFQDILTGTNIRKTYAFLKSTEKWQEDQLAGYQWKKLQQLISHAYSNVPYYHDLFVKNDIHPDDVKNLTDFKNIPILTKETARGESKRLIAKNININSRSINKGKTGGTTGSPLPVYKDLSTRNFTWGAYYRWYGWMGISPREREVVLWGSPKVLGKNHKVIAINLLRRHFSNTMMVNAFNLNENSIPGIVEKIIKYKPSLIRGYLSAIYQVGHYLLDQQITIPELKAVSTTTETLLPHYRAFLEKAYRVPVYDQYGCGECGSIAFECNRHNGLHITEEHVHIEILDYQGKPVFDKAGRIILTDLDNYAMPFIRYENGDLGTFSHQKCSCGVNSGMLKCIDGRSIDTIILKNGNVVHGVFFTDILYEMKNSFSNHIKRFQVYQGKSGEIEFRIESRGVQLPDEFIKELQALLNRFFDLASIQVVDKLENDQNGKFRYIVSDIFD
ncbi:MAG: phenylacetate--CoA ligase family protein [Bacteroidales bacterium]|nr:phenylacetate--CoA ligase family protein [Bacteroidales bacterium]